MRTQEEQSGQHGRTRATRALGALALIAVMLVVGALSPILAGRAQFGAPAAVAKEKKISGLQGPFSAREARGGVDAQIVGGKQVPNGKYPFIVTIRMAADGGGHYYCGGSILDSTHILTAAHCTEDQEGISFEDGDYTVGVGETDRSKICEMCYIGVADVFVHPNWDAETYENDVAVLKLRSPIPAQDLAPVTLIAANDTTYDGAGQKVTIAGWGTTREGGGKLPKKMREAKVQVVGDSRCEEKYEGYTFDDSVMLCAAAKGKDSCQGDSGGPLFVKRTENETVTYVQTGIVSWGVGCARKSFPGIYTEVSSPTIRNFIATALSQ